MNIQELQKQIMDRKTDCWYVFVGDEIAVEKIYINKIAEVNNLPIVYVDSLKSIYGRLHYQDMFNQPNLYVVTQDDEVDSQDIANMIVGGINGNVVVLKYDQIDKRSKLYKDHQDSIVEFNKLSEDVLTKYILKDFPNLWDSNCKKLIKLCDGNYNRILLELDKLRICNSLYGEGGYSKVNSIFEDMLYNGVFHEEISDITFDFVNKVIVRNKECIKLYQNLKEIGESNIKLLSLLYTNFKTILLIQCCKSKDVCKTTGLQYYQVKYNQDNVGYYSISELVNALRVIQSVEMGIKTGKIDEDISIDYVLSNVL